jgi:hypothetical protein
LVYTWFWYASEEYIEVLLRVLVHFSFRERVGLASGISKSMASPIRRGTGSFDFAYRYGTAFVSVMLARICVDTGNPSCQSARESNFTMWFTRPITETLVWYNGAEEEEEEEEGGVVAVCVSLRRKVLGRVLEAGRQKREGCIGTKRVNQHTSLTHPHTHLIAPCIATGALPPGANRILSGTLLAFLLLFFAGLLAKYARTASMPPGVVHGMYVVVVYKSEIAIISRMLDLHAHTHTRIHMPPTQPLKRGFPVPHHAWQLHQVERTLE